jgi:nuclear pore complex protein Nup133
MFSPEASIQSGRSSLRNPRRRQRTSSGEPQAQPRRKRNKLTDETFVAKDEHVNGNGSALMNGHAEHSPDSSLVLVDMPVREKKTPPKRPTKEDNGLYLVRPCQLSWIRHMLIACGK